MNNVDEHILNTYGDYNIREYINNLPSNKKRIAILSLLLDNNDWIQVKNILDNSSNPMHRMLSLHKYIDTCYKPLDISDESTPSYVIAEMLESLPMYLWKNPFLKWLFPTNARGSFPIHITVKLMDRFKNWEIDKHKRYKYIIEDMLYVCDISYTNMFLYQFIVDPYSEHNINYSVGNFIATKVFGDTKFDIAISNPPYRKIYKDVPCSAKPLYHFFVNRTKEVSRLCMFLTPSKWFAGGRGLDKFRHNMVKSKKVKFIRHYDKSSDLLKNNRKDIKGGISYFLYDNDYNGDVMFNGIMRDLTKYDIITQKDDEYLHKIISKYDTFLDSICVGRGDVLFGIETNDIRLKDDGSKNTIVCHVSAHKGHIKHIDLKQIEKNKELLPYYKVITPRAATKGGSGFGVIKIAKPNEVVNGSYLVFVVKTEKEAESLKSYLNTNLANKFLTLRKISQDIKKDTVSWIPLLSLDRKWDNNSVMEFFGIKHIF